MKNLNVAFALCAGLLGGVLSHYLLPASAQAAAPVVAAQSFALVDDKGTPVGVFAVERLNPRQLRAGEHPTIVLYDANGQEIWHAGGRVAPLD